MTPVEAPPLTPATPLAPLQAAVTALLPHHQTAPLLDLTRARLADGLRDQDLEPPLPEAVATLWQALDDDARRRVSLLVDVLRTVAPDFGGRVDNRIGRGAAVVDAVFGTARDSSLLTLEILQASALRTEEFTRRLLARLRTPVAGENAADSAKRLEHLDYGRLLRSVGEAETAAAARVAELQKRKEQQEASMRGRGKW